MSSTAGTTPLLAARERLEALDGRTVREIEHAARVLTELIDRQASSATAGAPVPEDLAELRALRQEAARSQLHAAVHDLERQGPDRLALAALDLHTSMVDGWIRLLPATLQLTRLEAVELASSWGAKTGWRHVARLRRGARSIPVRAVAEEVVRRLAHERLRLEGEYAIALADALRQIKRDWGATRVLLDARVDRQLEPGAAARVVERARQHRMAVTRRLDRAVGRRRGWLAERLLPEFGRALVRSLVFGTAPRARGGVARRPVEQWRRRCEAVRAELKLEQALARAESQVMAALEQELMQAQEEEAILELELARVMELLRRVDGTTTAPQPGIVMTPAATRVAAMARALESQAAALPERLDAPPSLRGSGRGRGRSLDPPAAFLTATRQTVLPACAGLFAAIEAEQHDVARDLHRACDVVAFALRTTDRGEAAVEIVPEAVANALTLLEFRRDAPRSRQADGMRAGAAVCRACRHARIELHGSTVERMLHRAQENVRRGAPAASAALLRWLGRGLRQTARLARGGLRRSLARIGWLRESSAGTVDIAVRPVLPAEFAGDAARDHLPALYRHLFRPDPVEDPRFLIGRAAELEAIGDARARWEAGRSAGIVITGERGSGKTSLINCALLGPLEGLLVSRGEFRERTLDADSLRATLTRIAGAEDPARLEEFLLAEPRMIVIEELERTFLRHIGRYDAVRALGRIINATSARVLWVVVLNEVAFRFLDAAVGLGHRFSHRIDAGTATSAQLRNAVLVRHDLSGLRLHFEPGPDQRGVRARVRALFNGRADAEMAFFDMIAQQSGGVYRTAFNIWLGHIAEISEGLCTISAPAQQDLTPLIDDLSLQDLFTLVALLQHGSLTPAEHAVVFQQPLETSRAQIDELIAREIVAPDPGRPGYRVRPEAMSVAQEALFRRNLL